jgi:hypothetical protein
MSANKKQSVAISVKIAELGADAAAEAASKLAKAEAGAEAASKLAEVGAAAKLAAKNILKPVAGERP